MYDLYIENEYKQMLKLSEKIHEYSIMSVAGLDPPTAQIYEMKNSMQDGNMYNNASLEDRIIVITLAINGPAETNRLELYKYLKIKRVHRIYFKNGSRDVYIDGYLENFQISFFEQKEVAQATFRCPDPYFKDFITIDGDISVVQKLFEFPFEIEEPIPFSEFKIGEGQLLINKGDVETGMLFKMYAERGTVINPVIYNLENGEKFALNITMQEGDEIDISTIYMKKAVTRIRDGEETNLIDNVSYDSTWLQLKPGGNTFLVNADVGAIHLDVYVDVNVLYQGV